jgi:hypothetical protein
VLGEAASDIAGKGAGLLMEWSLGDKPTIQSVQIAHDSPIVSLVYGPWDNGPVITADAKAVFRVWEFNLERGLCFSQQVNLLYPTHPNDLPGGPAMAVEQPGKLYVSVGAKRLYVWQRQQEIPYGRN